MLKYFSFINEELRHRNTKSEKIPRTFLAEWLESLSPYLLLVSSAFFLSFYEIWTSLLVVIFYFVISICGFGNMLPYLLNIPVGMFHHFYVGLTPLSCDIPFKMLVFTLCGGRGTVASKFYQNRYNKKSMLSCVYVCMYAYFSI